VTQAYWYRDPLHLAGGGLAAEGVTSEIAALAAAQQYLGHQLVGAEFRSFDLQSPTKAVVTAETWSDTLYAITEYFTGAGRPHHGAARLPAGRHLHAGAARYRPGPMWQVTNVVYASERRV
jgi:hypothetical protein